MTWHLANPALLAGLAGITIPIVIHFLSRRRAPVVDWGAMQFLELGRRARRKFQLTELLLMLGRMVLLALVALAVTKPFWTEEQAVADTGARGRAATRRDIVLILDGSDSMERKADAATPHTRAVAWARDFVGRLGGGSSVAVLVAKDQVKPLVDALSFDFTKVDSALKNAPPPRGSSDLPSAIAEALRLLEKGQNPARDVIVLTDGQKVPWRSNEPKRWSLIRDLHKDQEKRLAVAPRIWAVNFAAGAKVAGADGSVDPLEIARGLVPPGGTIRIRTNVLNAGPASLTRTAELLVDGKAAAGSAQVVGPIPAGSKAPLTFQTSLAEPGSHLLTVRLAPSADDPMAANDESARPIEVTAALPVCLVDGEPGLEPLSNETDFLRAALAPTGDDTPQVRTSVVKTADFGADSLKAQKVVVLANLERLQPAQAAAVAEFLGQGGGVLVAPGDRSDVNAYNEALFQNGAGWLPAKLGDLRGEPTRKDVVAHPAPASFTGPVLAPLGQGEAPPLADADLFFYRTLTPASREPVAAVIARLDTGDPWIVERPYRKGRVILLAGPVDAEGGTLPVNPDFVPWAHELVFHLADPSAGSRSFRPGEPMAIDLEPAPPVSLAELTVDTPAGQKARARIERVAGGRAQAILSDTSEPGIYRIALPDPPGGFTFATVVGDPREADPEPLAPADMTKLSDGWLLTFESRPSQLPARLLASGGGAQHSIWRGLVLAALAGLCLEVWLTRRLVIHRGLADVPTES